MCERLGKRSGSTARRLFVVGIAMVAGLAMGGCSTPAVRKPKEREYFFFPVTKYGAEPVYNRITPVYLPNPLPKADKDVEPAPRILPIIQFEVKDATLEEAAMILASTARYQSYCASSIAHRKVSFAGLGTVDELAQRIADAANIAAIVDHSNREVRFLSKAAL